MKECLHTIQAWLMLASMLALAVIGILAISPRICEHLRKLISGPYVLIALSVGLILYGGAKNARVIYPYTDPTQVYLRDNGSYVDGTTGTIHLDFTRIIVPSSANVYVDKREVGDTSDLWVNHITTTFAAMTLPYEFHVDNATNWQWMVYTDWTPGPAVQTNGVWHANWGLDRRKRVYLIPLRTAIRVNGETIATPKSKEDSNENE